jgi:hypothetical protein
MSRIGAAGAAFSLRAKSERQRAKSGAREAAMAYIINDLRVHEVTGAR